MPSLATATRHLEPRAGSVVIYFNQTAHGVWGWTGKTTRDPSCHLPAPVFGAINYANYANIYANYATFCIQNTKRTHFA